VFLVSCVLFLGIKNAEAASKIITVNALPVADLYNISGAASLNSDQTNIALMGFQLKNTGGTSGTVTGFTLSGNGNNLQTYFPAGFRLYSYTSAVFPGTGTATLIQTYTSPNATTSTVTLPAANNVTIASGATAPLYYFIVANFTDNVVSATTDDNQFSITAVTVSTAGFSTVAGSGPDYIISSPVTLGTASTTGLATNPLNADALGAGIMGFSITTTQSKTFTQFNLTASQNTGNYFSNVKLYRSTTNSFAAATQVTGITVSSLASTTLTLSGFSQTIPATTYYYFVVADFTAPVTGGTFQLSINSAVATSTYTNGATISGTNYTVSPPVTIGTASTTGLATSPLNADALGTGIMGFSITTTQSKTFTQFNLTASQNTGNYFSNVKLYRSTTNSFAAATQVTGITVSSLSSTTLTLSGFSQTIPATTYYYFIVADFSAPNTSGTFQLSINSAVATSTYTNGATISGTNYTVSSPITLGTASTTGIASTPLSTTQTGMGILGFSVAVTGTKVITQVNLTASVAASYFTNYQLYSSTTNSFAAATLVAGSSFSGAGTTTLTASGFSKSVTNSTIYFFIVADFTSPASAGTFQITANSVVATSTFTNGGPIASTSYVVGPITYSWVGNTATAGVYLWSTATNWSPASVPGPNDDVQIGISAYTVGHDPVVNTPAFAGSITFGDHANNNMSLTVNSTLTVTRDITKNSDANSETATLSGTGTINVANINISSTDNTNSGFLSVNYYIEAISSSVNILNISGNISLTSYIYGGFLALLIDEPEFNVTGGTTNLTGILQTNNAVVNFGFFGSYNSLSALSVSSGATLNVYNSTFLSGLDNNDESDINFNTGSIVQYLGSNQTVYTNSISTANAGAGISYSNLVINGTGTATTASGTLTVNNNFTNSSNTTVATNSTIVSVTNQLIPTAGTLTCGSATLTTGSMHFTGGNLTASSGTVTCTGTYTNDGGLFNCGTAANAKIYFGNTYKNNSGTFTANPTSTSSVYFTGTNQTLQDNTTAGTTFNNVTFSGNNMAIAVSTGAAGTGNFAIANTGTLTMGSNAKLTAGSGSTGGAGYLTLMSTASSTASVAQIPTTSSIVGAVNVQRYITGGTGTRGYRLLSSPVNISTNAAGAGNLSLAYLNTNASFGGVTYPGALTMGPGTGFTINGSTNPIIYLYDETRATNNVGFTTGKNIGIYNVGSTTVTTLTGTTQAAATIPVGNSYLLYYVGNNTSTVVASTRVPDNTIITATGYINQGGTSGNIPVKFWKLGTTPIPYDVTAGTSYPGLNQVGNPFPCTISLNQLSADNTAISKIFWELIPGGNYVSYSAGTGHPVSDTRASNYIVSGQGFLIQAQGIGETLTFKEGEKVSPYPTGLVSPFTSTTSTALLMSLPTKPGANTDIATQSIATSPIIASAMTPPATTDSAAQAYLATRPSPSLIGLHLQMTKDSLNYIQTGIYFNNNISNDNYSQNNDAINVNGSSAQVFLASYSADNVSLGINQLSDYTKGKRIKLYTASASTGLYTISLADIANIDTGMYNVYLIDKKMTDSLDMVRYKSYAFNINNSDTTTYGANRFVLAIERKTLPPYQLTKFAGQKVSTGIQLNWQTINEGDYTGFALQKLTGSGNYSTLYSLQSNSAGSYNYIDKHVVIGNNTYRLQQTGINGNITYSSPVTINYDSKSPNGNMTVYPNPSKSIITVSLALNAPTSDYIADIYNTSGTIIAHQVVKANTWTQDISSYKLGVYIIEVKTNSGDLVGKSKFVKIN